MNKWGRRFFYLLAILDCLMGQFFRWYEHDYGQAGYWLASASIQFLIGNKLFNREDDADSSPYTTSMLQSKEK